jgi:ElaB/YqjD/DUF883 family membrane-anchored ribosome-binding protein
MTQNEKEAAASIENLIGSVREDIAKLTEALGQALSAKGAEATEAARKRLENALERGRDVAGRMRSEASVATESLQEAIEARPLMAVLIALVVGFFAGSLLRR